jgi:hypothetical protein
MTQVLEIEPGRAWLSPVFSGTDGEGWGKYVLLPGDGEWLEGIDYVVPAIGRRSREDLFHALQADERFKGIHVERIGDCIAPRLIQIVMGEAYETARKI